MQLRSGDLLCRALLLVLHTLLLLLHIIRIRVPSVASQVWRVKPVAAISVRDRTELCTGAVREMYCVPAKSR